MRFVAALRPERIRVRPAWRTFGDTIAGLVEMLGAQGAIPHEIEASAIRGVTERETQESTALLDIVVGVPHTRLAGLSEAVAALAVSPAGLYEAVPTVPISIVALVLSPPTAIEDHLRILANVATSLRSEDLRADLLRAPDGPTAHAVLLRHARSAP